MSNLFLTPEEVEELTGYSQAARQRKYLNQYGIPFYTTAAGTPKILRSALSGTPEKTAARRAPPVWRPEVLNG